MRQASTHDNDKYMEMISTTEKVEPAQHQISWIILGMIIILVTFMTGSPLQQTTPILSLGIKVAGYLLILGSTFWLMRPIVVQPDKRLREFFTSYGLTLLIPLVLYFVGLSIGAFNGPSPLYSLWQTISDAIVFLFAFVAYGWLVNDLDQAIRQFFKVLVIWTLVLMTVSLVIYIGNLNGWWEINAIPFRTILLMNGPFNHANHLGYVLMSGAFASASLYIITNNRFRTIWLILSIYLIIGVAITFARGAMIGTAVGIIGILALRHRRIAVTLTLLSIGVLILMTAAAAIEPPWLDFLPKADFSDRGIIWGMAVKQLREYGPLGVGAGQAESFPDLTMHNFWLEQYGEGGVLTALGVVGWFIFPIIFIKRSRLNRQLAWCIVAMMIGVMVHGIFWGYFLNGLRFLTLIYACLWTALATVQLRPKRPSSTE